MAAFDPNDESTWPGLAPAERTPAARRAPARRPAEAVPPAFDWQDESTWGSLAEAAPPAEQGSVPAQAASSALHGAISGPLDVLGRGNTLLSNLGVRALNYWTGAGVPELPDASVRPEVAKVVQTPLGLPADPPPTLLNNIAEGVGGGAGPGLLGKGAGAAVRLGLRAAERGVPEAAAAVRSLLPAAEIGAGGRAGRLISPTVTQPLAQGAGGGASGATVSLVQDTDWMPPWMKTLAPIAAAVVTGAGAHGVGNAVNLIRGGQRSTSSLATAGLLSGADDPPAAVRAILDYNADPESLSRFQTTAEVTGQPGLLVTEKAMRSSARPAGAEPSDSFSQHDAARMEATTNVMDQIAPAAAGTGQDVAALVEAERQRRYGDLDTARTAIGPAPANEAVAGARLQQAAIDARQRSREGYEQLRAGLDPGNTSAINVTPIKKLISARLAEEFGNDPALWPADIRNMNERLAGLPGKTATLRTLDSIRQDAISIGQDFKSAPKASSVARDIADAIGTHIDAEAGAGRGVTPEHAQGWRDMNAYWAEHKRQFGPLEKVTERGAGGTPAMGQYQVPGELWKRGAAGGQAMREVNAALTDPATGQYHPEVAAGLRQKIAHDLAQMTGPDGLHRDVLADYLHEHSAAIGELRRGAPDLARQLATVGDASRLVSEYASPMLSEREASVNAASHFAKKDVTAALKDALTGDNSERMAADLVNQTRRAPVALAGLRNAYLLLMAERFNTTTSTGVGDQFAQSSAAAEKFMRNHDAVARILFADQPEAARALADVRRDFQSRSKWSGANRTGGSDTAQKLSNLDMIGAYVDGSGLPPWATPLQEATFKSIGRIPALAKDLMIGGATAARAKLYRALVEPGAARDLLREADPVMMERALGRLRGINWMGFGARGAPGAAQSATRDDR
jgi:hypothetical protein